MTISHSETYISPLSFLNYENYQSYNRDIARLLGSVNASIMLSEMVNRFQYHSRMNELINNEKHGPGWFYYTIEKGEERTCLSSREQETALKILEEFNFIEKKCFGLPSKRHFKINELRILAAMGFSNNKSSYAENAKLDLRKTQNCTYIEEHHKDPQVNTKIENPILRKSFGKYVKFSDQEYDTLCQVHGKEKVEEIIQSMNDYCINNRPKGYADYVAASRTFIKNYRPAIISTAQANIESEEKNRLFAESCEKEWLSPTYSFNILSKGVELTPRANGLTFNLEFSQKGFSEQLINGLRKHGFNKIKGV